MPVRHPHEDPSEDEHPTKKSRGEEEEEEEIESAAHLPPPETAHEHQDDQVAAEMTTSTGGAVEKLFRRITVGTLRNTVKILRDGQKELMGLDTNTVTTAVECSCFALVRTPPEGNWEIVGEHIPPEDGQLLYLFDGICVLHAALNTRPGLDGDGKVAATMIKFSNYVATPLAEFAPKDQLVGVIIVNAIPGEAHPVAEHLAFNPRDADATATGIGGRTHEETIEVINGTVERALNDVSERLAHLDLDLSDMSVDVHSGKVASALREDARNACRWCGDHPSELQALHAEYMRTLFIFVGLECNHVFTPLTANLGRHGHRGLNTSEMIEMDEGPIAKNMKARPDQTNIVTQLLNRFTDGDSGAIVWAPTGYGKTVIMRDLVRLLRGKIDKIIVLTTVNLVGQTQTAVELTENADERVLSYSKPPEEAPLENAANERTSVLVLCDESTKITKLWKEWVRENGTFTILFTATPYRCYLEDLVDISSLIMDVRNEDKNRALSSLDLVVRGFGVDAEERHPGAQEEVEAYVDFIRYVDRIVVKPAREEIEDLMRRSIGQIESFNTLMHVGATIEKIQRQLLEHAGDIKDTSVSYLNALLELVPNAAMARMGPLICEKLEIPELVISPLELELFDILDDRLSEHLTTLVVFPSYVAAACEYMHAAYGLHLGDSAQIAYIDARVCQAARKEILARFSEGDVKVLFATTGIVGYGFNFDKVGATIMMTSPWTAEEMVQTIGRGIRIGKKSPQNENPEPKKLMTINGCSEVVSASMARNGRARMRVWMHIALFNDPVVEASFGATKPLRLRDSIVYTTQRNANKYISDDGPRIADFVKSSEGDFRKRNAADMDERLKALAGSDVNDESIPKYLVWRGKDQQSCMFEEAENEEGDEDAGRKAVDTHTKVDRICQYHRCRVAELLRKADALGVEKVRNYGFEYPIIFRIENSS